MRAVNLIPADQRTSASVAAGRSGGAAYAVLALIAGLALMALLYGLAHHQIASKEGEVAKLQARAQQAQQQASALSAYTSFVAMRQQRVKAVEALVDSRFDWAHVMHEFGRVIPAGASLTSLQGAVGTGAGGTSAASSSGSAASSSSGAAGAAGPASATPPGSVPTFQLTGCARSHSVVANTLNRLRLIDGVSNVSLQSSAKSSTSGAASAGGGGCPPGSADFAATIAFQPLPATAAAGAPGTVTNVSTGASG